MWKRKGRDDVLSCLLKILSGSSFEKHFVQREMQITFYLSVGGFSPVFKWEDWSVLRTPLGKWTVWTPSSSKLSCNSHLPSGKAWHDWAVSGRDLDLEQWKNTEVCQIGMKTELSRTQNSMRHGFRLTHMRPRTAVIMVCEHIYLAILLLHQVHECLSITV